MTMRTSQFLVPFVFCAMGIMPLFFAGCEKKEPVASEPHNPTNYMRDAAFRQTLATRRHEAHAIGSDRQKVADRMEEMVGIMGKKLKTDDRGKIVAELEKNAEWRSLEAQAKAIDAKFERHRKETLRLVRERITPKNGISK